MVAVLWMTFLCQEDPEAGTRCLAGFGKNSRPQHLARGYSTVPRQLHSVDAGEIERLVSVRVAQEQESVKLLQDQRRLTKTVEYATPPTAAAGSGAVALFVAVVAAAAAAVARVCY